MNDSGSKKCEHNNLPTYVVEMLDTFSYEHYEIPIYPCCGRTLQNIRDHDEETMQRIMKINTFIRNGSDKVDSTRRVILTTEVDKNTFTASPKLKKQRSISEENRITYALRSKTKKLKLKN